MRERGSALITAVISIMVLLLVSGVFFSVVLYQTKVETSEEKALRAYYVAEAGINYEVAAVLAAKDNIPPGDPIPDDFQIDPSLPQSDVSFGGGTFTVSWHDNHDYTFMVKSIGTYEGITRTLEETYKYNADHVPTP